MALSQSVLNMEQVEEKFVCKATEGRTTKVIYESVVKASFVNPLLELQPPNISFVYVWSPENPPQTLVWLCCCAVLMSCRHRRSRCAM